MDCLSVFDSYLTVTDHGISFQFMTQKTNFKPQFFTVHLENVRIKCQLNLSMGKSNISAHDQHNKNIVDLQ